MKHRHAPQIPPDIGRENVDDLRVWLDRAAEALGIDVEVVSVGYGDLDQVLVRAGPAIIGVSKESEDFRFLAILKGKGSNAFLIGPDLQLHRVAAHRIRQTRFRTFEARTDRIIDDILSATGARIKLNERSRCAWRAQLDPNFRLQNFWLLRPPPAHFFRQLIHERVPGGLGLLLVLQIGLAGLTAAGWLIIGKGSLNGYVDWGWLIAWVLLLLSQVPVNLFSIYFQGAISLQVAKIFKQLLLYGAQRLNIDDLRQEGSGRLLGRVIESQAMESLAIQGGFQILSILVQSVVAPIVLSQGAAPRFHVILFAAVWTLTVVMGVLYYFNRLRWSETRLGMTGDLVERMVGHRTRIAQQSPEQWHRGEDQGLHRYLELSAGMDRTRVVVAGFIPRAWLVVALAGLAPAFAAGGSSPLAMATSVAGILVAQAVMLQLGSTLASLSGATVAWHQVRPIFSAARLHQGGAAAGASFSSRSYRAKGLGDVVLEGSDLVYRYRGRPTPALTNCNLSIRVGDRILLEGPSGGGKTTLANVLAGLRRAESGLLLLNGLDFATLGSAAWRQRVVSVPQFHENHVFTGSLAFNLLMGKRWPPLPTDLEEATARCEELGLADLLARMPSGLNETVGETGWQLSHGEKSRLYIARALLQGADVLILDESFAALDPENLRKSMRCVLQRAPTLIVIAHP